MPNFPLPEFFPDVVDATLHEPSVVSGESAAAREAGSRAGAGGIAPASLTPATFGLGTGPLRAGSHMPHPYGGDYEAVRFPHDSETYYIRARSSRSGSRLLYMRMPGDGHYIPTNLFVHFNSTGKLVLENRSPMRTAAPDPQPGPSRGMPPQAAGGSNANSGGVLEDILEKARGRKNTSSFRDEPVFQTFQHGEKLPLGNDPGVSVPNRNGENREYVMEQLRTIFRERGYRTTLHDGNYQTLCLDVTHPPKKDVFQVHVKLSSDGMVTLPRNSLVNAPYLLAVVSTDARDGALKTLRIIPINPGEDAPD
jgi:hypothetical protein